MSTDAHAPRSWDVARDRDGNAYIKLPHGKRAARQVASKMGVAVDPSGVIAISEATLLDLTLTTMKAILDGKPTRRDVRRWLLIRQLCTDVELEQVAEALGASGVPASPSL